MPFTILKTNPKLLILKLVYIQEMLWKTILDKNKKSRRQTKVTKFRIKNQNIRI